MPKPPLRHPFSVIENQMIDTMIAGLHQWRPDLNYPESYSDMQGCARGLLQMFDVKRLPLAKPISEIEIEPNKCEICKKPGYISFGGLVYFCGNDHAREFAKNMLNSMIGSKGERGVNE